jgi:hypothetical protein
LLKADEKLAWGKPVNRNPITGIAGCWARTVSGQAAAPLMSVMNSRRRMGPPLKQGIQSLHHRAATTPLCITAKLIV